MEVARKPYQGVWNIIRFNRNYYFLAAIVIASLIATAICLPSVHRPMLIMATIVAVTTIISLAVSYYVYDMSGFYQLTWLGADDKTPYNIANITAGFDETSVLLKQKFSNSHLMAIDFYDGVKHTEPSIKRARKAYPPYPGTRKVTTQHLPYTDASFDRIFMILSVHEIRNEEERMIFFNEIKRVLKPRGQIIVTEHLRDVANFLAYNIGFLHFHSGPTWYRAFNRTSFKVVKEMKITPFITTFIIEKNGMAN